MHLMFLCVSAMYEMPEWGRMGRREEGGGSGTGVLYVLSDIGAFSVTSLVLQRQAVITVMEYLS